MNKGRKKRQKGEWRKDWLRNIRNCKLVRAMPPQYAEKTTEDRRRGK